ncbi:MAG TPA: LysR substrate-binding domain-containing protein [Candidatus Acidoferrales bacterium]|nr:LysR substrate-binding domain-containing protein [Candidatus Acidoferrales bacterium]
MALPRLGFTLEQVRTFLAVAEQEHISRAARTLFLTQGAVTQQVHNFERALDLRLLERRGRRVYLTDAGRSVAVACRTVLNAVDGLAEMAHAATALRSGSLEIGASPTAASHYLPQPLARFAELHPGVRFRVVVASKRAVVEQLAGGTLDCALIEGAPRGHRLLQGRLVEDEVILVAHPGHPLHGFKRLTAGILAQHRYLAWEPGTAMEEIAPQVLGQAYERGARIEFGHLDAVRGAAVAGLGYALLPTLAVVDELAHGTLKRLRWRSTRRWVVAVRRPAAGSPSLEAFWSFLINSPGSESARGLPTLPSSGVT